MNLRDIKRLEADRLITPEQTAEIMEFYGLREPGNRFQAAICWVGGLLILFGLILLIAANWDNISHWVKLLSGASLMAGAHLAAIRVREKNLRLSETLHVVGSGLLLTNLALIGQVFHLSAAISTTFLVWTIGVLPIAWVLRSEPQFIISMLGFWLWFTAYLSERQPFHNGESVFFACTALMGIAWLGLSYFMQSTRFKIFSSVMHRTAIVAIHLSLFPAMFMHPHQGQLQVQLVVIFLALLAAILTVLGTRSLKGLTPQWQNTWMVVLLCLAAFIVFRSYAFHAYLGAERMTSSAVAVIMAIFCLFQMNVGAKMGCKVALNFGIVFLALYLVAIYILLFGTMLKTGAAFILSGALLIALAVYLEKKRRSLLVQMEKSL